EVDGGDAQLAGGRGGAGEVAVVHGGQLLRRDRVVGDLDRLAAGRDDIQHAVQAVEGAAAGQVGVLGVRGVRLPADDGLDRHVGDLARQLLLLLQVAGGSAA